MNTISSPESYLIAQMLGRNDVARLRRALINGAARRYGGGASFAHRFASGKLGGDPAFTAILALGLLPDGGRVLDLGCGQGLLGTWMSTARRAFFNAAAGDGGRDNGGRATNSRSWPAWPADWPVPAQVRVHGVERMPRDVARAQIAYRDDPSATIEVGDIRTTRFDAADAVVILDVLHYLDHAAQEEVLDRVRAALGARGRLLLRVGDADGGFAFAMSRLVDHLVVLGRGGGLARFACRPLAQWQALLVARGFRVRAVPMSHGTPFANVLLVADLIA